MRTQTIYDLQTHTPVAVEIYGNFSGIPVYVMNELVDALGGIEPAFHEIKRLQNEWLLPRIGSEGRPLTLLDLRYARENEHIGYRHWQWRSIIRGHTNFYGYGYVDGNEFCFCRTSNDTVEFRIKLELDLYPPAAGNTNR
jgi:hypothetical protein